MKHSLIFIAIICGLVSCKSRSLEVVQAKELNKPATIESVISKFDSITDFSYTVDQVWKMGSSGSGDSLTGDCEFTRIPGDTIIGAHYKLTGNNIIMLYNGDLFLSANEDNKSVMIYKLDAYPDPGYRVISPMLYFLSYNEIMNEIKERYHNRPNTIIHLNDTIIGNKDAFRVKIVQKDTVIGQNHNEIYELIAFNKETLFPVFAAKIYITPGDIISGQTIEARFSRFHYSTAASDKAYDISSIPFNIQSITQAADK